MEDLLTQENLTENNIWKGLFNEYAEKIDEQTISYHINKMFETAMKVLSDPHNRLMLFLIISVIIIGISLIVYVHYKNNKTLLAESLFNRLKVSLFGYNITLNPKKIIDEQIDRFEAKSADYIDEIYWIKDEEITHRFKERPKAIKEVPVTLMWIPGFIGVSCIALFQDILFFSRNNWKSAIILTLIITVTIIAWQLLKSLFPSTLKSCRSWAISSNYFIQVQDSLVEIELRKDHIFYIDFNGQEIIFDLDCSSIIASEDSGRDDRLVLEDLNDPEETYKILKEWFEDKETLKHAKNHIVPEFINDEIPDIEINETPKIEPEVEPELKAESKPEEHAEEEEEIINSIFE